MEEHLSGQHLFELTKTPPNYTIRKHPKPNDIQNRGTTQTPDVCNIPPHSESQFSKRIQLEFDYNPPKPSKFIEEQLEWSHKINIKPQNSVQIQLNKITITQSDGKPIDRMFEFYQQKTKDKLVSAFLAKKTAELKPDFKGQLPTADVLI